ncbi:MAG: NAD(P)-binding domain-containing protein [Desulfuromusa sp.]|nr:NAD(P)-binding domain-containing protein [Desulfuromusa sp.]
MKIDFDCIVIGAGPSGIVTVKECVENGLDNILAIDQALDLGGNFNHSYDSLTLTSSCTVSMFSDFWIGDGYEKSFWKKSELVNYWRKYVDHYRISEKFRFNTSVTSAMLTEKKCWEITLDTGELLLCTHLVVAVGSSNYKSLPSWHEKLTDITYLHSKDYRNASHLKNKNVLIVGGGESASDIALEIAKVAKKSWVSLRTSCGWITPRYRGKNPADLSTHRGFWGLPREFGKKAAEAIIKFEKSWNDPVHDVIAELNTRVQTEIGPFGIYGTKTTALPEAIALHGCKVVGEITDIQSGGRILETADGNTLKHVDVVVFCTGYKNIAPFFRGELSRAGADPRSLYKHMFHPDFKGRLCWVGTARPCFGSQFPLIEIQARYCGLVFSNKLKLPTPDVMRKVAEKDSSLYLTNLGHSAERIRSLVDYHIYLDDMADVIGCSPPLWKYFFLHPWIWLRMVYGPTQSTQFRLKGPNAKKQLAHEIIKKIPLSAFTHIVKLGIRGRIYYFFKKLASFSNKYKKAAGFVYIQK